MTAAPLFSIVTPVFNPPIQAFRDCVSSVSQQICTDWEWILVDDGSSDPEVEHLLSFIESNSQVTVIRREKNGGIVAASNDGIHAARGQFIALLDHDDQLTTDALESVRKVLSENEDIDYVYSDEDKVNEDGHYFDRFRKPRFSPERLRGQNYCCHFSVIRASLVQELGGFREGFDGSQDYDLFLRVTEQARAIAHIPKVLYHWRSVQGSASLIADAKPYALIAAQKAVQEHLDRIGITGVVETTPEFYLKTIRTLTKFPRVSIIIPTCGTAKRVWGRDMILIETAVASIFQRSTYTDYEIVVVYDSHTPSEVLTRLSKIAGDRLVLTEYTKPFNFSEKINLGAVKATGDVLILLNDDTQIETPDWIEGLIGFLEEPDVGMVGPKLLLEDMRIQSAGHYFKDGAHNGATGSAYRENGPFSVLTIPAERSGLTMACVAIPRRVFEQIGGLCTEFPGAFNDVDFGNKLTMHGYRMIWTPHVEIFHFESLSRDPKVSKLEVRLLEDRWGSVVLADDEYLPDFESGLSGIQ
jgi:glycosyltransferase involved in cell wall biosynthesis